MAHAISSASSSVDVRAWRELAACDAKLDELRSELHLLEVEHAGVAWHVLLEEAEKAVVDARARVGPMQEWVIQQEHNPLKIRPPLIRPPGYKIQSGYRSAPSWSLGQRTKVGRNVDPLLPDDGPGPGTYVPSEARLQRCAPAYSLAKHVVLSRNVDPTLADDNPG
eukprot:CAMPEP_0183338612 /NCGR_PEP_ID=MMETSP0164_2-20130417/5846_1 /TAXON_ID=221442 /ORGANISM="Coccolithus pelagicus ssp braarudi, Strain PLY182g" /LENGTH=165 /DNA_ID=CAMNT_0025508489 /DNA_START=13 /DNA_END=506 /DNA_ORIENTATION=+